MSEIHKLSCAIHDSQSCNCGLPERAMGEPAKTLREIVDQYLDRLLPPSARARIEADLLSWAQARERRYGERVREVCARRGETASIARAEQRCIYVVQYMADRHRDSVGTCHCTACDAWRGLLRARQRARQARRVKR